MRLCGFMSCRRILLSVLRDKVSQGTERLSWVPLSTSPPFRFRGDGTFFPEMTPLEYGEFLCGFYPRFDRERFTRLLDFFELGLSLRQRAGSLSKGQKTRLELAAGFSRGAKYLLLDEPFSGKDVFSRKDFLKLLTAGLTKGETLVISTHDVEEMENIFDRAILLRYGGVKADLMAEEWQEGGVSLADLYADAMGYDPNRYREFLEP